jgi:hypothetical protein
MIYRIVVLTALSFVGVCASIPVYAGANDVRVVNGACESSSHTAEGPIDSDVTKRQSLCLAKTRPT